MFYLCVQKSRLLQRIFSQNIGRTINDTSMRGLLLVRCFLCRVYAVFSWRAWYWSIYARQLRTERVQLFVLRSEEQNGAFACECGLLRPALHMRLVS